MPFDHNSRRRFLRVAAATAVGSCVTPSAASHAQAADQAKPPAPAAADQSLPVRGEIFPEHMELVLRRSREERERLKKSLQAPGARPLTVAVHQMANHCDGEAGKQANLARMLRAITTAAEKGAQVLAFPEMCLPGYFTRTAGTPAEAVRANHALADRAGHSDYLAKLQTAARDAKLALAFGFCEREGKEHYNAIGVIDADGAWLGSRRKNPLSPQPYETGSFAEPDPSKRSAVFKCRYATLGVANCFDGEFPESIRRMRLDGAELLLWCNAATGNPRTGHSARINSSACYAQSNRMWVACCNAVGGDCYGTSVIVGPAGEPLVILSPQEESLGLATINLAVTADWERWRDRLEPKWRS